jgi:phosphoglycolate phosphatase
VLKAAQAAPHESYYVGDEVRDIVAAKEVGVSSVAVTWGYSRRSALEAERPDVLVDRPEQLGTLLDAAPRA